MGWASGVRRRREGISNYARPSLRLFERRRDGRLSALAGHRSIPWGRGRANHRDHENRAENVETITAIRLPLDLATRREQRPEEAIRALGEGWVGEEALAIGLYAALVGGSFTETLAIAANHDGDSDSTASIAGQLFGAWKGAAEIPHAWYDGST
jgi:ADP-ribosylglycohydrolase